jgi:hypothetical protein
VMRLHLFWQVNGHSVVHAYVQSNKVAFLFQARSERSIIFAL